MDTTAAAELAAGMAMAGDSVVLWEGVGSDGGAGWSDEDYDAEDSDWANKNRRYPQRHSRPPEKRLRILPGDGPAASFSARIAPVGESALTPTYIHDPQGPETFEFPGPMRTANGGGGLQKQSSVRGSNSFSGELSDMGSTLVDSLPASGGASGKGKGTGSIFFKTKLCCKFRAGTCPYNSNCNFAHGMEELRKPPPGWEEMVAAQEAERASRGGNNNQIQVVAEPTGGGNQGDSQRFHKTPRPCRKFYTEEGCPYGDRCIFMHDDQGSQVRVLRESNAISLGPMTSQVNGASNAAGAGGERPSNWKTRVCNKWETTGHCPFGQKCHFVHGNSDGSNSGLSSRHGGSAAVSSQVQRQGSKAQMKWKGPTDEISTIYGDWIEEDEWESIMAG